MADNRITKHRLKNHWAYSWWKYALMAVCVIFGVNMLFTVTAYRPPEYKKVELYLCKGWADTEQAYADLWPVLLETAPDQEELTVMNIDITASDYYTVMQFSTYMAAQQGDILLIPKSEVKKYAADDAWGTFADLTPYLESGALNADGLDLSSVTFTGPEGETGVFGIPADTLYGLIDYGVDPGDSVFVITAYSGNEETSVSFLQAMLELYQTEKPENYDEWHKKMNSSSSQTTTIFQ